MADNVTITPGSGNVVAADEVTDGTLGQVKVQYVKLMDGTLDGTNKLLIDNSGAASVKLAGSNANIGQVDLQDGSGNSITSTAGALDVNLKTSSVTLPVSVTGTVPISGAVSVSNFPASQAVTGTFFQATQPVSLATAPTTTVVQSTGTNLHVVVDSAPSTPVTGSVSVSNFPATQPISAASLPLPTGASTSANQSTANSTLSTIASNTTNAGTPVVSGTVTANAGTGSFTVAQATGTNLHVVVDSAPTTAVTGTFFQATQPISAASLPLPTGAAQDATLTGGTAKVQITQGGNTAVVDATGDLQVDVNNPVQVQSSTLIVTATAATGVAVTATLPAVASQFHYISLVEIVKYFTVANAASATPLVVTTTNLPGPLAFTFGQPLGTVGTTDRMIHAPNSPIHSVTANTATTIVCPATTGIIWRVNVYYFAAV